MTLLDTEQSYVESLRTLMQVRWHGQGVTPQTTAWGHRGHPKCEPRLRVLDQDLCGTGVGWGGRGDVGDSGSRSGSTVTAAPRTGCGSYLHPQSEPVACPVCCHLAGIVSPSLLPCLPPKSSSSCGTPSPDGPAVLGDP